MRAVFEILFGHTLSGPWGAILGAVASAPEEAGRREPLVPFILYFLLVSLVVALATSTIRLRDPRKIVRESNRFFLTIVIGIFLFSLVVFFLEWLFVRPLI